LDILVKSRLPIPERFSYLKTRLLSKEYTEDDLAKFICVICSTKIRELGQAIGESSIGESSIGESSIGESSIGESSIGESSIGESSIGESSIGESSIGESSIGESRNGKQYYSFTEIEKIVTDTGLVMPWKQIVSHTIHTTENPPPWPKIREFIHLELHFCIQSYINYIKDNSDSEEWNKPYQYGCGCATDIQIEFWKIISYRWVCYKRAELINLLPDAVIIEESKYLDNIYRRRLYNHPAFEKIIKDPANNELKVNFANIIIEELWITGGQSPDLGYIIVQFYSDGIDILEYFKQKRFIAEAIFAANKYYKLSPDVLAGLIKFTANGKIIQAFQSETIKKHSLGSAQTIDKLEEFARSFEHNVDTTTSDLSYACARLVAIAAASPIRYWSENDYKYACFKGSITAEILQEFKRTQPVPHPDWDWKQLTIILGTDQTILAYPELPWMTPVYYRQDNKIVLNNIDWDYLKDRTLLFSADCIIWSKFSTKLPIDFILQRPNYNFDWNSVVTRNDFKFTPENWAIALPHLHVKQIFQRTSKYPLEIIVAYPDLGWDWVKIFDRAVIPMKYLRQLLSPRNSSKYLPNLLLRKCYISKFNSTAHELYKRKLILKSLNSNLNELRITTRAINYVFGDRPHIEKIVLGFATKFLVT
jgi:hypothetical protein